MFINFTFILEALIKFGTTILFTFILSLEREWHDHPGGVITHILVGLGSCLFSLISVNIGEDVDKSRIAAQIVSGVGFLGSATVFKSDSFVKGINTAANLWISAAIGMAVGLDLWEFALILSIFVCIILIVSNMYKKKMYENKKFKKEKEKEKKNLTSPVQEYDNDKDIIIEDFELT